MKKLINNNVFISYLQIVIGCFIGAIAYPTLLIPNHIAPGGLTGFATVLNYIANLPVGLTSLIMNIPLFIIGYNSMGKVFAFRSLIATLLFSFMIDIVPFKAVTTTDPLLAAIFGGTLVGIGLGLVIRGGATTGGTDMIARMIHNKYTHISVGTVLFLIDCLVVVLAGVTIEIVYSMYAFICLFVVSKLIDVVIMGFSREKACYIISTKNEEMKTAIMTQLDRGVTSLSAKGGYSGTDKPVLLCLLSSQEVGPLKNIIRNIDSNAFVFISDAHEVLGEGFRSLNEK